MRDLAAHLIENARRSGDRIGVDRPLDQPATLGDDVIRLARLATSIHLAHAPRILHGPGPADDRASPLREPMR